MNILGISSGSESGVALFQNNRLVSAVNEERLSRIKFDHSYPIRALTWCLNQARITPDDVDIICYGFTNGWESREFISRMASRYTDYAQDETAAGIVLERLITEASIDSAKRYEFEQRAISTFPKAKLFSCHHHEAHKSVAFAPSPFTEALIITADGRGDFKSLTISEAHDCDIKELYNTYSWESIGYFFGRVTQLCGFLPNRHEGKVVGLSAAADPQIAMGLMKKMIDFDGDKIFTYPGLYYRPFFSNYSDELKLEATQYSREELAAAAQRHLENIVCGVIQSHVAKTRLKNVCLAGGVFANVLLNQKIKELDGVKNIFVYPNMGDGGLCVGAIYTYLMREGFRQTSNNLNLYLGPEISNESMIDRLARKGIEYSQPGCLTTTLVEAFQEKKIVGLVQGRAEFGPRALGNRSILMAADDPILSELLNHRLGRNDFMPFAPVIADNLAHRCLENYRNDVSARYMTMTYRVTDSFQKNSPGVVHIDDTVRPQVVSKQDNPFLYQLLNGWYDATGKLCLINTSFNLHEEPIVCNENEIVSTFERGSLDLLAFPPFLAGKYVEKVE